MFIIDRPENYYDEYCADELHYFDEEWDIDISEEETILANNLFDVLQDLINENEKIDEQFTSIKSGLDHFKKHCLGKSNKRSDKTRVYYDFVKLSDYLGYEDFVSTKTKAEDRIFIEDILLDISGAVKAFRKLFEGNACIVFGIGNGFVSRHGAVRLCFRAFAIEATENYLYNTIDLLVQAPNGDTVSLYPIDANYLETKINNEIKRAPRLTGIKLNINH